MYSIQAIRAGDEQAFQLFYELFYDRVHHFIAKRTNNTAEIKDLTQDVFLKIFENRAKLTDETSLEALTFTIARNIVIDYYRRNLIQEKHHALIKRLHDDTPPPDYPQNSKLHLIQEFVETLPNQRRTIFKLSKYNGWTSEEIAEELSLSKRTVENHLYRAIKTLKAKLSGLMSILF